MLYAIVFAHVPPSVGVSVYHQQKAHEYACVCSRGERRAPSPETDRPVMGDHWKIGRGFPYLSVYGSVVCKKCMPYSEVARRSCLLIDCVFLICLDAEEGGRDSGKVLESSRSAAAANSCSLCTYRIWAAWPLLHQGVCMDVINRDLG